MRHSYYRRGKEDSKIDRNELLNDHLTAQRYLLDGRQSQIWTAFPAIVQSVDLAAMTLTCVPAINGVELDDESNISYHNMPVMEDVPIVFPSAGGFSITFPIAEGDEVLCVIANRCIDSWWQNGGFQNPIEFRMHDLSDGFAIPGPKSQPKVIGSISSTDLQVRNDAGDTFLSITSDGKIGFQNAATSLKTMLENFQSALSTFMETIATNGGSEPTTPITWSALATLASTCEGSLADVLTELGELLE